MDEIISRARWGARHKRGFRAAPLPAQEVWLHHSTGVTPDLPRLDTDRDGVDDDEERAMRALEDIGEDRFGGGISYTWLVMPSGRIYEGHGVDREGAHTGGRNSRARAICLVGNYEIDKPTEAQIRAVAWLLRHAHAKGWIRRARLDGGHRDVKATACPGRHAYAVIDDINQLAAGEPVEGGQFMALSDKQQADLFTRINEHLPRWVEDIKSQVEEIRSYVRPGTHWKVRDGWLQGALSNTNTQLPAAREELEELHQKVDALTEAVAGIVDKLAAPEKKRA